MKMSDILRQMADKMDAADGSSNAPVKQTGLAPVGDVPGGGTDTSKMVPPLQAKLELLKKSQGLPNVYDKQTQPDELTLMKQRAGLTAAQHEASEDNDITG